MHFKQKWWVLVILLASVGWSRAEMVAYHLDGYEQPKGSIAFLGCVYSFQEIFKKDTHEILKHNFSYARECDPSDAAQTALKEIFKSAKTYTIPLETINLPANYQSWVVGQISKKQIDPAFLGKLCGNKTFALIATVDRYGIFPFDVHMRLVDHGKYTDYYGVPAVMEYEGTRFYTNRLKKVVAVSFYLSSVQDGKLVWQANALETSDNTIFNKWSSLAHKCADHLFVRLLKL
jgi:hypothetical protein